MQRDASTSFGGRAGWRWSNGVGWWLTCVAAAWSPAAIAQDDGRVGGAASAEQRLTALAERYGTAEAGDAAGPAQLARDRPSPAMLPDPKERLPLGAAAAPSSVASGGGFGSVRPGEGLERLASDGAESLPFGEADGGGAGDSGGSGGWFVQTLGALGVVVGLVLAGRWLVVKKLGLATVSSSTPMVEVLSRSPIAPRSHVLLLRVGRRVLVVSDSSQGARTLAEVDDPEEVAELIGTAQAARPTSVTGGFRATLDRLRGDSGVDEGDVVTELGDDGSLRATASDETRRDGGLLPVPVPVPGAGAGLDSVRETLSSLTARVRAMRPEAGGQA